MMEARELRIGNYYDFSHSGQIEQITGKDIYEFESDPIDDIYQPLPLTEEWLLRFGFEKVSEKSGTRGIYSNGRYTVYLSYGGNVYTINGKLIGEVHTFQNIYYYHLLTGEELTLEK